MDSEKSGNCSTDKKSRAGGCKPSEPICSTVRLQRNQAEKQRRDRFNGYISELSSIVPMVKNSSKPVDKVSVLRLAAAHMRLNISCLNLKNFKSKIPALPAFINSYLELVEKNIGGFIVVTTFNGIVLFCSKCVEDFVGYQCIDIIGQSIYSYVDSKEVPFFQKKVNSAVLQSKKEKNATKVIKLHMQQRPMPRSNEVRYQKMLFKLSVHSNEAFDDHPSQSKSPQKTKKVKHKDFGASSVVLMFVEPMKMEPKINRAYLLTHQDIYFTIHGLQGEIMYADQRIATITGYMPHDVQGKSAYQFILDSDIPIALFAQKAMFTSNDGTGSITYRLKIFDSTYIYLQSKGQIIFKDNSKEMSHFVCYNKWLSEEEGNRELIKFQERYAPQISDSKDVDVLEKSSNIQSLPLKSPQQENNDAHNSLKPSNKPHCMDETSTLIYSENVLPEYEGFIKNDHPENSATILSMSSIQSLNGSIFMDKTFVVDDKISVQSCKSELKNSKEKSRYAFDEFKKLAGNEDSFYTSDAHLRKNQVCLQKSNFNQLGYADKTAMLNGSNDLNVKEGFSATFFQSQTESAYLPPLNLREIESTSVESGHNGILPEMHNKNPPLVDKFSSFTQFYNPIQEPVNGFSVSKEKMQNVVNGNVIEGVPKLNPVFKPTINENPVYSRELCNNYTLPRYESNGHYNMHSSYTSSKRCYQNFTSNEIEYEDSFAPVNSAALHVNSKNFGDSSSLCSVSFIASQDAPLYCNGTGLPPPIGHSLYTNGDLYNHTNGFNVSEKTSLTMNGISHTEVQKRIFGKNRPVSLTNDAYTNPAYGIPAKRIKTDAATRTADNRNGDALIHSSYNDCHNLFSDVDLNNGVSHFFQDIKTSSFVGEAPPVQRNSGSVDFEGELYNELDMFFKQLPSGAPQSQLSYEVAQSTDCD